MEEFGRARSIEHEFVLIFAFHASVLVFLAQEAVSHRESFDFRAHEAAEGLLGCAHDGLAANVEAGVDDDRAATSNLRV